MSLLTTFIRVPIKNFDISNKENVLAQIEKMAEYDNVLFLKKECVLRSVSYFRNMDNDDLATLYYLIAQLIWVEGNDFRKLKSNICLCTLVLLKAYIVEYKIQKSIRDDVDFIINFARKTYPLDDVTSSMVTRYFNSKNIDILDCLNDYNILQKDDHMKNIDEILKYSYDLVLSLKIA